MSVSPSTPNRWLRLLRHGGMILGALGAVGLLVLIGLKWYLDATYFQGYDPSAPLQVEITEEKLEADYRWTRFYYRGFREDRVPAVMVAPRAAGGPLPCVVFVHGIGNDKEFMHRHGLDLPFVKAGFAFVCFDQLTRGERKLHRKSSWAEAEAFRVRAAYTVGDVRRLMDYLSTRSDIATNRIYLCGASYGAITGSTATAFDSRIRAATLVYGGGNLWRLLSAEAADELGQWRLPAYLVGWYFGSVFDPIKYVGRIAPRPVLLQNGKADTVVSPAAARALQEAAREPKKIIWYEGDHLGKTSELDQDLVVRVVMDAIKFLQEVDAQYQPNAAP